MREQPAIDDHRGPPDLPGATVTVLTGGFGTVMPADSSVGIGWPSFFAKYVISMYFAMGTAEAAP
jgi:hypothetical protein